MATQRSVSMPQWKEPDTVADKVLKRAEVSKVSCEQGAAGKKEAFSRVPPPLDSNLERLQT